MLPSPLADQTVKRYKLVSAPGRSTMLAVSKMSSNSSSSTAYCATLPSNDGGTRACSQISTGMLLETVSGMALCTRQARAHTSTLILITPPPECHAPSKQAARRRPSSSAQRAGRPANGPRLCDLIINHLTQPSETQSLQVSVGSDIPHLRKGQHAPHRQQQRRNVAVKECEHAVNALARGCADAHCAVTLSRRCHRTHGLRSRHSINFVPDGHLATELRQGMQELCKLDKCL